MTARTPDLQTWMTQFPWQAQVAWAPQFPMAVPQAAQQVFKLYRTAFDTWLAVANAGLAGAEHMRMAQLATDVETLAENHRASEGLAACTDLNGLLAVQTALARAYLGGCAKYWTALAESMQATQAQVASIVSSRAGEMGAAWQGAVREAAGPQTDRERKAA